MNFMNKKKLALILLLSVMAVLCAVFVRIDARNMVFCPGRGEHAAVTIKLNAYEEKIYPYYSSREDTYYFFLPSMLCDHVIYNDSYLFTYGEEDVKVRFMVSSALPALFITTEEGHTRLLDEDKTHTEPGWMDAIEADGSVSYSGSLMIHGRGNSSFSTFLKKPYNIELNKAAGILGMNRDKDWCLLANAWDYSYMNNKLALDMAAGAGFEYVPDAEYADIYFNGNYYGIYLVAEKAEVSAKKISITDLEKKNERANPGTDMLEAEKFDTGKQRGVRLENLPSDITGGYWIEADYRLGSDYTNRIISESYFETDFGTSFGIRSPKYADEREIAYISSLVNEVEQAVRSEDGLSETGKTWLDYIDLTSWVRWYMVAEIANDPDKGVTNTYYYKDADSADPKLRMGPVWDYDNRFGGTEYHPSAESMTAFSSGSWIGDLCKKPEFLEAVRREWASFFRDGYPRLWPKDGVLFTGAYNFDDEADYLKNWIGKRREFLDSCWSGN